MKAKGYVATAEGMSDVHDTFLVYGTPDAPYWFLGLEEGYMPADGTSIDDLCGALHRKSHRFRDRGVMSLRELAGGGSKHLPVVGDVGAGNVSDIAYQPTWGGYIKLLLSVERPSAEGQVSWRLEDVKRYQKYRLGSLDVPEEHADHLPGSCLMELFDLPWQRSGGRWPYAELAERKGLEYLANPVRYRRHVLRRRVEHLLELLQKRQPRFLMCFGAECRDALRAELRGSRETVVAFEERGRRREVFVQERGPTIIVFALHPAARGLFDDYWVGLGKALAERFPITTLERAA